MLENELIKKEGWIVEENTASAIRKTILEQLGIQRTEISKHKPVYAFDA